MRYVIGYAGIPAPAHVEFERSATKVCGQQTHHLSAALDSKPQLRYTQSHANHYLRKFAKLIEDDKQNKLEEVSFAIIYVQHDAQSTTEFAKCFFPSTLVIPVDWKMDQSSPTAQSISINLLIRQLADATHAAKQSLDVLKRLFREQTSRTPLLLPIRNFDSKCLFAELTALQAALPSAKDKEGAVKEREAIIKQSHPPQRLRSKKRDCFVDDRDIEFHPPGKARHAVARVADGHGESCLLAGRRRLGAPFLTAFHYDCEKGAGNLRASLFNCHGGPQDYEGAPHINIAPNDFVRV